MLAGDVATPLLHSGLLPTSLPMVKLLFASAADATFASASILDTSLPVAMLGQPTAVGPRDGAFVVVAPMANGEQLTSDLAVETALNDLLQRAAGRLVVVINPRLADGSPLLSAFEAAYTMRPYSLAYLTDQYADKVSRVRACLLRCWPHEWSVLFEPPSDGAAAVPAGGWRYAGRFETPPQPAELQALLSEALTRERNDRLRQHQGDASG